MSYNKRIDDNHLKGEWADGDLYNASDLNEIETIVKTAINANYEDIQKFQDGTIVVTNATNAETADRAITADTATTADEASNALKLGGNTLSKAADEELQYNDTKIPSSMQVYKALQNTGEKTFVTITTSKNAADLETGAYMIMTGGSIEVDNYITTEDSYVYDDLGTIALVKVDGVNHYITVLKSKDEADRFESYTSSSGAFGRTYKKIVNEYSIYLVDTNKVDYTDTEKFNSAANDFTNGKAFLLIVKLKADFGSFDDDYNWTSNLKDVMAFVTMTDAVQKTVAEGETYAGETYYLVSTVILTNGQDGFTATKMRLFGTWGAFTHFDTICLDGWNNPVTFSDVTSTAYKTVTAYPKNLENYDATKTQYVVNSIGNLIWKDGVLLDTASAQTIDGLKSFSVLPQSSVTPTNDNDFATKKYVDDNAGGSSTSYMIYGQNVTLSNPIHLEDLSVGEYSVPNYRNKGLYFYNALNPDSPINITNTSLNGFYFIDIITAFDDADVDTIFARLHDMQITYGSGTPAYCEMCFRIYTFYKRQSGDTYYVERNSTYGINRFDFSQPLTTFIGYDASATQVLKNVNGTLTWVTE